MKLRKRLISLVLACALLFSASALLIGCKDKSNELIVFTMFGGDDPNKDAYMVGVNEFKKAHPEVHVEDQSIQAVGEGFDDVAISKFVSEKYVPDVLYIFSPGRNLPIQDKLAKVADIRAKHPDYGKGFPEVGGDPHALAFLGNSFGIYYEKSVFTEADFASYTALKNKLKTLDSSKIVDAAGETNTWLNYIGLQKMGKKWADVQIPNKKWFQDNRADLEAVLTEMVSYMRTDLNMGSNPAIQYGDEKQAMWNGNKSFDVNGNWNAAGFYPPHSTAGKASNYAFRSFVIDDNPATTDIDESKYVMSGFFHGWMISKKCFENPEKLKLAVDFVNKQCKNVLQYPGMAANGATREDDTDLAKQTKDILKKEGAIMCSPLDDKFLDMTAKTTFFTGLTNMILGTKTPAQVITDTINAFVG
ncbi:MAG TPA: ABC transporter substrate-binding protein [Clostridia bacterium]